MTPLDGWDNFYVIIGSSAGALIGLQFVVIALISDMSVSGADIKASAAFGTPNVVHFAMALLISAIMVVPWDAMSAVALVWGIIGGVGVIYALVVGRRMLTQTAYKAVLEDWLFHLVLPLAAYATPLVGAILVNAHPRCSLFAVAAASLLLLFIGIHNAWDTVTWHVFVRRPKERQSQRQDPS